MRAIPRNFYDIPFKESNEEENENIVDMEPYQQNELGSTIHGSMYTSIDDDNIVNLSRDDIEGLSVDMDDVLKIQKEVEEKEEDEEEEEDDNDIDVDDSLSNNAYMIGDMENDIINDDMN